MTTITKYDEDRFNAGRIFERKEVIKILEKLKKKIVNNKYICENCGTEALEEIDKIVKEIIK